MRQSSWSVKARNLPTNSHLQPLSRYSPCNVHTGRHWYTYDANSNRLNAVDKTTSDTDLDGDFDASDFTRTTRQSLTIDGTSNRLLGFTQTLTNVRGTRTLSSASSNITYSLDAAGNLTSDGLRSFDYDEANRLARARVFKDGEEASIRYLHNAAGQRVFKGEPEASQTLPSEATLGQGFIDWLRSNFRWLFAQAQANTSIGTAYTFADGQIPSWAVLGEYDNGSATGAGRSEYIWLPTADGAIPLGMFRNGKFFAIHSDHLGTPRLMTSEANQPVWQWPYSAFGTTKPTGVLKATPNPRAAITNIPVLLKATAATELNLRFPGQYDDAETGTFYNYQRQYLASQGRYTQNDPIGLRGGLNAYLYAAANPLSFTDPTGLYIPYWHRRFTMEGANMAGLPYDQARTLSDNVVGADFSPGSQEPVNAHWHAMCMTRMSKAECKKRFDEYMAAELGKCTMEGLGNALHALQDSFARGHRNFQSYSGLSGLPPSHPIQDSSPNRYELHAVPRASADLISNWRKKCGC